MRIAVGRWDYMTHIKGLTELNTADEAMLFKEVSAEIDNYDAEHELTDNNMGVYELEEFEITFNTDHDGVFNGKTYWMRVF